MFVFFVPHAAGCKKGKWRTVRIRKFFSGNEIERIVAELCSSAHIGQRTKNKELEMREKKSWAK